MLTRGTTPVSLGYLKSETLRERLARFERAIGGEENTLVLSRDAVFNITRRILRTCRRIDRAILPSRQNQKHYKAAGIGSNPTKVRINRWRAYQQFFLELMGRSGVDAYTDGDTGMFPRYVVLRMPTGRCIAMSLWSRNAIYVSRSMSTLFLTKKEARDHGAVRICRRGDWREQVLSYFGKSRRA